MPGGLAQLPPPSGLWALVGLMAIPGFVSLWRRQPRLVPLIVLWITLPVLAFLPTFAPVYTHYLIVIIPALALLSGLGIVWLAETYGLVSRLAVCGVAAAILFSQGVWWNNLLQYINTTATLQWYGLLALGPRHIQSAIRISPHYYNTEAEVDLAITTMRAAVP